MCIDFLNKNVDRIFAFLREALDPQTFCFTLGLCRERFTRIRDEIRKLDNEVLNGEKEPETKATVDLKAFWDDMITTMEIVDQFDEEPTVDCMMCNTIVDATAKSNTEGAPLFQAYGNALDIRDMMKGDLKQKCTTFVYMYMDTLVQMIKDNADLSAFCPSIEMCYDDDVTEFQYDPFFNRGVSGIVKRSVEPEYAMSKVVQDVIDNMKDLTDGHCYICEWLVNEVDRWATEKKTKDEIKQYLTESCAYLPDGDLKEKCDSLVNEYAEIVIDMIVDQGLEPKSVCQKIGYCKDSWETIMSALPLKKNMNVERLEKIALKNRKEESNGIECELCKELATELKSLFDANKDRILKMLEGLCDKIPAPYGEQCHKEVDENFPVVVSLVDEMILNPDTMCEAIGACSDMSMEIIEDNIWREQETMEDMPDN